MSEENEKIQMDDVDDILSLDAEIVSEEEEETKALIGDLALAADMVDERVHRNDKLSLALKAKDETSSLYDILLAELAREAANLEALQKKAKADDLVSKAILSEKRILTLEKVAKMISQKNREIKDKQGGKVDFYSDNFQDVLGLMTSLIVQAVEETGMQKPTQDRFLLKLKQKLTGFEELAADVYSGKSKINAENNAKAFRKTRS